ncbi:MAG: mannose-1-phosphate guanylyltransferase/mannose-6-phosphate isomerase [Rhodocyclaceae bacterium]|nr:mannose-1-phosphate guanylyltransferase/mannose-6-phosphate isomerase [Rhodocyclaceae bacterium]
MMRLDSIQPVILCGGAGTRLWPLSRAGFPKQFLCLTGEASLFQQTVSRLQGFTDVPPLVVCHEDHRFLVQEQLRECGQTKTSVLLEPAARNTAPALTLAALAAQEGGGDPVLVVTPADQNIADEAAFLRALQAAVAVANEGAIALLGVPPSRPETGYGYIQTEAASQKSVLAVRRFVEKPDGPTAQAYLAEGGYYWNAGIFVLKASVWCKALEQFRPDIAEACRKAWAVRTRDGDFLRPAKEDFLGIPSESIDYAVMERCPDSGIPVYMVPLDAGWSDLGAWDAVWEALPKDEAGNAHFGDVLTSKSRHTLVHASHRLVAVVGVENLVVVETADAVLVADRAHCQEVKTIVTKLDAQQRDEHALHRKVHRPWGWYDGIDEGHRFKVKRIMVKPGASLSLQKHYHRAEHWVVVKGTAQITRGEQTFLLTENQSTYIPLGEVHRLANPGTIPLEIIEVQSGSYLGEDDIVRIEDHYGRHA